MPPYKQDIPSRLASKGLITGDQQRSLEDIVSGRIVSLHYELRVLMYLGVMLFSTGLGILVYKNIENIGHEAILFLIAVLMIGCFTYAIKNWRGSSFTEVESTSAVYDYIVLLGALLFATTFAYGEFIYQIFSGRPEIVAFIIGIFYYACAYAFDHRGVLVLSFASFATCVGLRLQSGFSMLDKHSDDRYGAALLFGTAFSLLGFVLHHFRIKRHFTLSYINVCGTVFQLGAATAFFNGHKRFILTILLGCSVFVGAAFRLKSFALLLNAAFFAFITVSYIIIPILAKTNDGIFTMSLIGLYVILSGVSFMLFIKRARAYKLFKDE